MIGFWNTEHWFIGNTGFSHHVKSVTSSFLKAVFRKFYLVHSWILCPFVKTVLLIIHLCLLRVSELVCKVCNWFVNSFVINNYCRFLITYHTAQNHTAHCFPLRISSVNVTKSAVNSGFGHIYWRNP